MKLASLLVSAALLASPLAHANLVQNGDFNQGDAYWTYIPSIYGIGAGINKGGMGFGGVNPDSMDSFSQNLTTTSGSNYLINFDVYTAGHIFQDGTYKNDLRVLINGAILADLQNKPEGSDIKYNYNFKATTDSTLLTFAGYNLPSATYIRYVSVSQISPVPEPETYALMGMGLLAITLKLRKKKKGQSSTALPA